MAKRKKKDSGLPYVYVDIEPREEDAPKGTESASAGQGPELQQAANPGYQPAQQQIQDLGATQQIHPVQQGYSPMRQGYMQPMQGQPHQGMPGMQQPRVQGQPQQRMQNMPHAAMQEMAQAAPSSQVPTTNEDEVVQITPFVIPVFQKVSVPDSGQSASQQIQNPTIPDLQAQFQEFLKQHQVAQQQAASLPDGQLLPAGGGGEASQEYAQGQPQSTQNPRQNMQKEPMQPAVSQQMPQSGAGQQGMQGHPPILPQEALGLVQPVHIQQPAQEPAPQAMQAGQQAQSSKQQMQQPIGQQQATAQQRPATYQHPAGKQQPVKQGPSQRKQPQGGTQQTQPSQPAQQRQGAPSGQQRPKQQPQNVQNARNQAPKRQQGGFAGGGMPSQRGSGQRPSMQQTPQGPKQGQPARKPMQQGAKPAGHDQPSKVAQSRPIARPMQGQRPQNAPQRSQKPKSTHATSQQMQAFNKGNSGDIGKPLLDEKAIQDSPMFDEPPISIQEGMREMDSGHKKRKRILAIVLIAFAVAAVAAGTAIALQQFGIIGDQTSVASSTSSQSSSSKGSSSASASSSSSQSGQSSSAQQSSSAASSSSAAAAGEDKSGQVVYQYTAHMSSGKEYKVVETVTFQYNGDCESSTMDMTFEDDASARKFTDALARDYGSMFKLDSLDGAHAVVTIDNSGLHLSRAEYENALRYRVSDLEVINQ